MVPDGHPYGPHYHGGPARLSLVVQQTPEPSSWSVGFADHRICSGSNVGVTSGCVRATSTPEVRPEVRIGVPSEGV